MGYIKQEMCSYINTLLYSGKVWQGESLVNQFGESSLIRQTKTIQISIYNCNLLAESIHSPNFSVFAKCSKRVNSPNFSPTKLSRYMVYCGDKFVAQGRKLYL